MDDSQHESTRLNLESLGGVGNSPLAAMYQALVEEIPAILYINGPSADSPTLYVSPQTESILGLPADAWFDNTWSRHVHPDDLATVNATYSDFLSREEFGSDEYRFVKPDGQVIWLHDTVRVIRDGSGAPSFVQGIMFDITMRKRNEELLAREARLMRRIEDVGRRFTDILLADGDLQELLDALADVVSSPVALADAAHQLVGMSSMPAIDDAAVAARWEQHSRLVHDRGDADDCTWAFVQLRDEEWGKLHVLSGKTPVDEIDVLAVDRAAAAVGLWLLSRRERTSLADRARSKLLAELWQGRRRDGQDAMVRLRGLGADLSQPVLIGVALMLGPNGGQEAVAHRHLREAMEQLRAGAAAYGATCVAAVVDTVCLSIVGLRVDQPPRVAADRLAQFVEDALRDEFAGRIVAVGISRPGTADTIRRMLTEATDAAAYGVHSVGSTGCFHSADLGLRNLLARLGDGPELGRFVEDELGLLLAHDAKGGVPLIPTLRAYVDSGGRKSDAARALHIERRSLYYRLDRIESLLGAGLDDASVRLRTQVALHGLDVLRQRGAGYRSTPS